MTDIDELIARIEAADGPCRKLDHCVWSFANYGDCEAWRYVVTDEIAPYFTSSLDAAMTLIPDGYRLILSEWDHSDLRKMGAWQAILVHAGDVDNFNVSYPRCDHAHTPALAVCVAASKARTLL